MSLASNLLAGAFLCALGGSAVAQYSPAQMGITPALTPEVLSTLDNTGTWVPIGQIFPGHTFVSTGSTNITSVLTEFRQAPVWTASFHAGDHLCKRSCNYPLSTSPSYPAGYCYNAPDRFCGGTEGRQFATKNERIPTTQSALPFTGGELYLANGYWGDNPGSEGQQNAQVLILQGPESMGNQWQEDVNFGDFCPSDNPKCALATSVLVDANWTMDEGGNQVSVQTLVAGTWWQGTSGLPVYPGTGAPSCSTVPVLMFAKNNSDFQWYPLMVACEPNPAAGFGQPQLRSFSQPYTDQAVSPPQQYMFVGEAPTGIWRCQLKTVRGNGTNPLDCTSGLGNQEWDSGVYPPPTGTGSSPAQCTHQKRVMGFASGRGPDGVTRLYMSVCFAVYVRIDGPQSTCTATQVMVGTTCQQRWQLYWIDPTPVTSESGSRGLTFTADGALLIGTEGAGQLQCGTGSCPGTQKLYSIQPYPACTQGNPTAPTTCYKSTYLVFANTLQAVGMSAGNTVLPYNNFATYFNEQGTPQYLVPQSSYIKASAQTLPANSPYSFLYLFNPTTAADGKSSGKKLGEATYLYRNSQGQYNFAAIPQLFSTAMNGTRDMVMSPFAEECGYFGASSALNCAVYAAGYDEDGASQSYWCKSYTMNCPYWTPPGTGGVPPGFWTPSPPPYAPVHNTAWVAELAYPGQPPY